MAFHKPKEDTEVRTITVAVEPKVHQNKKGYDFIWVNESAEKDAKGWYCSDKKLFPHFHKGETVQCLVTVGDFKSIVDVVDESFVEQRNNLAPEKRETEDHNIKLINAKLDKIGKLVAEMYNEIIALPSLEESDNTKTEFPPKERPY